MKFHQYGRLNKHEQLLPNRHVNMEVGKNYRSLTLEEEPQTTKEYPEQERQSGSEKSHLTGDLILSCLFWTRIHTSIIWTERVVLMSIHN